MIGPFGNLFSCVGPENVVQTAFYRLASSLLSHMRMFRQYMYFPDVVFTGNYLTTQPPTLALVLRNFLDCWDLNLSSYRADITYPMKS